MTGKVAGIISKGKTAKEKMFLDLDFYSNPIDTPIAAGCPIFNKHLEHYTL